MYTKKKKRDEVPSTGKCTKGNISCWLLKNLGKLRLLFNYY